MSNFTKQVTDITVAYFKKRGIVKPSSGDSQDTLDAWTGGTSLMHKFEVNLFGWHIVFWRKIK